MYAVLLTALACPFRLQDADVSTPAKCKKILRDEGIYFAPDATHPRLALLAQTAVRKKRKLTVAIDNDYAEEIKVATSITVSELVDLVQKVISERDEVGYCVNVRCIINNITEPWTVVRCGRNKCTTIIKAGNALCGKCGGLNNDAYAYIDYLFQLTLEGWDTQDKMSITGVKKAGIVFVRFSLRLICFLLLCAFALLCDEHDDSLQVLCVACR